jgi:hypothetical protein
MCVSRPESPSLSALAICTKPASRVGETYYHLAGHLRSEHHHRHRQDAPERVTLGTKWLHLIESP